MTSLAALETAAAAAPQDPTAWRSALELLRNGSVHDDACGAAAAHAQGASRPLRVAVVTPYFRESLDILRRCHDSVRAQSYPCRHILVADGAGQREIDGWDVEHLRLTAPAADYGDTPRAHGGAHAAAQGYDAIAWLDADNTLRAHHVASLVARRAATGASVVFSGRTLHLPDGRLVPALDPADGRAHIDTSCMLFAGDIASMAAVWLAYPRPLSVIDDRLVGRILHARGFRFACTGALTTRYTVNYAYVYSSLGLPVPADARPEFDVRPAARFLASLDASEWAGLESELGTPVVAFLRGLVAHHGRGAG